METKLLKYKRIIIVDDEPDILDTLESLLPMCDVVKASDFEGARKLLETEYFDVAVLDIMGVDGYSLLEIAHRKQIIAVMLTAHALTVEDTVKSFKNGADYFIPKEKLHEIVSHLIDVFEARESGKSPWSRWYRRFASFYDRKFGPGWVKIDEEFRIKAGP